MATVLSPNPNLPYSLLTSQAVKRSEPVLLAGLDDDQADEVIDLLAQAVIRWANPYAVHLIDDMGGADAWTLIAHPIGSCPLAPSIHHPGSSHGDHGCSS